MWLHEPRVEKEQTTSQVNTNKARYIRGLGGVPDTFVRVRLCTAQFCGLQNESYRGKAVAVSVLAYSIRLAVHPEELLLVRASQPDPETKKPLSTVWIP